MSALGYANAVGQAAVDALAARMSAVETNKADNSTIPQPATVAPPMIADTSAKGTGTRYALEGHTHQSNVQAKKVQVVGSAGQAVWTFSPAFDVAPVVIATAETPINAAYTNVATILQDSVTTTSATIVVHQVVKSITLSGVLTSLLGSILILLGFAPANTNVNCSARKPS